MVHVAGAIANVDDQIRWPRILRDALGIRPPCCDCGCHVQLTTSMVVTVTESQGAEVPVTTAPPDAKDPRVLRHCPYIKARIATCEPVVRPLFHDVGRSIVLPWPQAAISILVPETASPDGGVTNLPAGWLVDPRNDETITSPIDGAFLAWDAWIWTTVKCTKCCEPSDAILTDSAILSASGAAAVLFIVPPGADELEVVAGESGATVNVSFVNGDGTIANSRFIGQSAFGNAAFGNQEPRCVCVPPRSTHVMVVTAPNDIPIALAWRVKP